MVMKKQLEALAKARARKKQLRELREKREVENKKAQKALDRLRR